MTWYLVIARGTRRLDREDPAQVAHRSWLLALHRSGRALFSGPTSDGSTGIYLLLADDQLDAERRAAEDPLQRSGDRRAEILPWDVRRAFRLEGPGPADIEALARAESPLTSGV